MDERRIDPATLSVILGWVQQIVDEVDEVLCRSAFSPVISEGHDSASCLFTENGKLVAQGQKGLPIFIATMQDALEVITKAFQGEFYPGDVIMFNDPYYGGTHLQDMKVFKPFFRNGKLTYWLGNTGHWADIGGATPGSFNPNAVSVLQEGLRIPPVKVYNKGELNEGLIAFLLANVRVSEERRGDLQAQVGCLNVGEKRLNALLDKWGEETVKLYIDEFTQRAEEHMRSYLRDIPDGVYSANEFMDNSGNDEKPVKLSVDVTVEGDNITFDFSNSDPPVRGPVNAGISVAKSGTYTLLMHTFPTVPINAGIFKPIRFVFSRPTFLNVSYPSPVSAAAAETAARVHDVCALALCEVLPQRIPANPHSTINSLVISGVDLKGREYVCFQFTGGGYGGYDGGDGFPYGAPPVGTSRVQPYEVVEMLYPLRIRRFSLRENSGGIGKYRGGWGGIVEIEILSDEARATIMGERANFAPRGVHGGKDGVKNQVYVVRNNKEIEKPAHGAKGAFVLRKGDVIVLHTPGGGGYGNPMERERALILKDIVNEFISTEEAEKQFELKSITQNELKLAREKI
ncbi:MAG: hydantoinase B/oxoprolinase family protein [Proteobacteria bacterium]|nr:hydantoinase B/oxoprolinase family protein [Pseudomonadota bacterium]